MQGVGRHRAGHPVEAYMNERGIQPKYFMRAAGACLWTAFIIVIFNNMGSGENDRKIVVSAGTHPGVTALVVLGLRLYFMALGMAQNRRLM